MIVAATGHRPNKLGGYSEQAHQKLVGLAVSWLSENKPDKLISGMALGWDQAWAAAGIQLKIPVVAAIPFYGQESMWPKSSQEYFHNLLKDCSETIFVCDKGYAPWKMQIRNEYMVDHCDLLVALWDGTGGGTANCLHYANKQNKQIVNLWEKYGLQ